VAELVQLKVDVLVSAVYPAIVAAKQVTRTIPFVKVITQDPIKNLKNAKQIGLTIPPTVLARAGKVIK
jgi:hypothetical protein